MTPGHEEMVKVHTLVEKRDAVGATDLGRMGPWVTWFELEGTGHSFPFLGSTLGEVHERKMEGFGKGDVAHALPLLELVTSGQVSGWAAATEQFAGSIIECGAEAQTIAAEFTGLLH